MDDAILSESALSDPNFIRIRTGYYSNDDLVAGSHHIDSLLFLAAIIVGTAHGGAGGAPFDDQIDLKLEIMTPCVGVELFWYPDYLFAARFIYPGGDPTASKVYHGGPVERDPPLNHETFMMQDGERINKVTWYAGKHLWSVGSELVLYVRGIQFYTNAGRKSKLYGSSDGDAYTESYDGFILGHAAGKSGTLIDQLQLTWINQGEWTRPIHWHINSTIISFN